MKKLVFISLVIFFAAIAGILVFGLFSGQKKSLTQASNPGDVLSNNQSIKSFTISEVSGHNNASSCWTIIHDKVYDVTSLIPTHSGGSEAILEDCGKDGTVGFDTKYKDQSHSSEAVSILNNYYVGDLKK